MSAPIDSLANDIEDAYPASHPKDGTVAGRAHDANSPNSDHRPKPISGTGIVRAIDFGEHDEEVDVILDAIRVSRDPRIKYGIHHGQMFSSYASRGIPPFTWRPYTRGGHIDHGHVSTLTSADAQAGPWDIGTTTGDDEMNALKVGSTGPGVSWYQTALNEKGVVDPKLTVDGAFGGKTEAAVKQYQESAGFDENGVIDGALGPLIAKAHPSKWLSPPPPPEIELETVKVSVVKGVKIK